MTSTPATPFAYSTKLLLTSAYQAAISAVQPSTLIATAVQLDRHSGILKVVDQLTQKVTTVQLLNREIYLIGAGKAVLGMATELLRKVEKFNELQNQKVITIVKGQLNIPHGSSVSEAETDLLNRHSISLRKGARNNIPDSDSVAATKCILALIREAKNSDRLAALQQSNSQIPQQKTLILAFISGGGSALLSLPRPPATLADKQAVISGLVKAGADIVALNTVRGRLSEVKHGQLAEVVLSEGLPLELVTFLVSDIIGDPIDKIASGPTVLPSKESAFFSSSPLEVLQKFGVPVSDSIKKLLETQPKSSSKTQTPDRSLLQNVLVGNNALAVTAAKEVIQREFSSEKHFKVVVQGSAISGEVKNVVTQFITDLEAEGKAVKQEKEKFAGVCLLAGGETTVEMKEAEEIGFGGRCQEMGLLFLKHQTTISTSSSASAFRRITALFGGTDGQDGPTSAAGVVVSWPEDTGIIDENSEVKVALQDAIKRHDSHSFFKKHFQNSKNNCLIETGPSGTNVMDLYVLIGEF